MTTKFKKGLLIGSAAVVVAGTVAGTIFGMGVKNGGNSDQAIVQNAINTIKTNTKENLKISAELFIKFSAHEIQKSFKVDKLEKEISLNDSIKKENIKFSINGIEAVDGNGSTLKINATLMRNAFIKNEQFTISGFLTTKQFNEKKVKSVVNKVPKLFLLAKAEKFKSLSSLDQVVDIFKILTSDEKKEYFSFERESSYDVDFKVEEITKIDAKENAKEKLRAKISVQKGRIKNYYWIDFMDFSIDTNINSLIKNAPEIAYESNELLLIKSATEIVEEIKSSKTKINDVFKSIQKPNSELVYKLKSAKTIADVEDSIEIEVEITAKINLSHANETIVPNRYKTIVTGFRTQKEKLAQEIIIKVEHQINFIFSGKKKISFLELTEIKKILDEDVSQNEELIDKFYRTYFEEESTVNKKKLLKEDGYVYIIKDVQIINGEITPIIKLRNNKLLRVEIEYQQVKKIPADDFESIELRKKAIFDLYANLNANDIIENIKGIKLKTTLPSELELPSLETPNLKEKVDIVLKDLLFDPTLENYYWKDALKSKFIPSIKLISSIEKNDIQGSIKIKLELVSGAYKKDLIYTLEGLFTLKQKNINTLLQIQSSLEKPVLNDKNIIPTDVDLNKFAEITKPSGALVKVTKILGTDDLNGSLEAEVTVSFPLQQDTTIEPVTYKVTYNGLDNNKKKIETVLINFINQRPKPKFEGVISDFIAIEYSEETELSKNGIRFEVEKGNNLFPGYFINEFDIGLLNFDNNDEIKAKTQNISIVIKEKLFDFKNGDITLSIVASYKNEKETNNQIISKNYDVKISNFKTWIQFKAEQHVKKQIEIYKSNPDKYLSLKSDVVKGQVSADALVPINFNFNPISTPSLVTNIISVKVDPKDSSIVLVVVQLRGFQKSDNATLNASYTEQLVFSYKGFISAEQQKNLNIINKFIQEMKANNKLLIPKVKNGDYNKTTLNDVMNENLFSDILVFIPETIDGNKLTVIEFKKNLDDKTGTATVEVKRIWKDQNEQESEITNKYKVKIDKFVSNEDKQNQIRLEDHVNHDKIKAIPTVNPEIKKSKSVSSISSTSHINLITTVSDKKAVTFSVIEISEKENEPTTATITIRASKNNVFFEYQEEITGFITSEQERLTKLIEQKILAGEVSLTDDAKARSITPKDVKDEHIKSILSTRDGVIFTIAIRTNNDGESVSSGDKEVKIIITAISKDKNTIQEFEYSLGGFTSSIQSQINEASRLGVIGIKENLMGDFLNANLVKQKKQFIVTAKQVADAIKNNKYTIDQVFKINPDTSNTNSELKYTIVGLTLDPDNEKYGILKIRVSANDENDNSNPNNYEIRVEFLTQAAFDKKAMLKEFLSNPKIFSKEKYGSKTIEPQFTSATKETFSAVDFKYEAIEELPIFGKNTTSVNAVEIHKNKEEIKILVDPNNPTTIIFQIPVFVGSTENSSDSATFGGYYKISVEGFKDPGKTFNEDTLKKYIDKEKNFGDVQRKDPKLISELEKVKEFLSGRSIESEWEKLQINKEIFTSVGIINQKISDVKIKGSSEETIVVKVEVSLGEGQNKAKNSYEIEITGFGTDVKAANYITLKRFLGENNIPEPTLAKGVSKKEYSVDELSKNTDNLIVSNDLRSYQEVSLSIDEINTSESNPCTAVVKIKVSISALKDKIVDYYYKEMEGFLTPAQYVGASLALIYKKSKDRSEPKLKLGKKSSELAISNLTIDDFIVDQPSNSNAVLEIIDLKPDPLNNSIVIITTKITFGTGKSKAFVTYETKISGFVDATKANNLRKLKIYLLNEQNRLISSLITEKKSIKEELYAGSLSKDDFQIKSNFGDVALSVEKVKYDKDRPNIITIVVNASVGLNRNKVENTYEHEISSFTNKTSADIFLLLRTYIKSGNKSIPSYKDLAKKPDIDPKKVITSDFILASSKNDSQQSFTNFQNKEIILFVSKVQVNPTKNSEIIVTVTAQSSVGNVTESKTYETNISGFADINQLELIEKVQDYIKREKIEYSGSLDKNKMPTTKLSTSHFVITTPTEAKMEAEITSVKSVDLNNNQKKAKVNVTVTMSSVTMNDQGKSQYIYTENFTKEIDGFAEIELGENHFALNAYLTNALRPSLINSNLVNIKSPNQVTIADLFIKSEDETNKIQLNINSVRPNKTLADTIDITIEASTGNGDKKITKKYKTQISGFIVNTQFLINKFVTGNYVPTIFIENVSEKNKMAKNVDISNKIEFPKYQEELQSILPSDLKVENFTFNQVSQKNGISKLHDKDFDFTYVVTNEDGTKYIRTIDSTVFKFKFEITSNDKDGELKLKITVDTISDEKITPGIYTIDFSGVKRLQKTIEKKVSSAPDLPIELNNISGLSKNNDSADDIKKKGIGNALIIKDENMISAKSKLIYSFNESKDVIIEEDGKIAKAWVLITSVEDSTVSREYLAEINGLLTIEKSENKKAVKTVENRNIDQPILKIEFKGERLKDKTVHEFREIFENMNSKESEQLFTNFKENPLQNELPKVQMSVVKVLVDLDDTTTVNIIFELSQGQGDARFKSEISYKYTDFASANQSALNIIKNNILDKASKAESQANSSIQLIKVKNEFKNKLASDEVKNNWFEFDINKLNDLDGINDFENKYITEIKVLPWTNEFTTFGKYKISVKITAISEVKNKADTDEFNVEVSGFAVVRSLVEQYIDDVDNSKTPTLTNLSFDKWKFIAPMDSAEYSFNGINKNGMEVTIDGIENDLEKGFFFDPNDNSMVVFKIKVSNSATIQKSVFRFASSYSYTMDGFKKAFFDVSEDYRIQIQESDGTLTNKYISREDYENTYKNNSAESEKITRLEISGKNKIIGIGQFENLINLKELILNEGIEKISENAFANSSKLTSITLPKSLETLDNGAFRESRLTFLHGIKESKIKFIDKTVFEKVADNVQTEIFNWKVSIAKGAELVIKNNLKLTKKPKELELSNDFKYDNTNELLEKNNITINIKSIENENDVNGSFTLVSTVSVEQKNKTVTVDINSEQIGFLSDLTRFAKDNNVLTIIDPTQSNLVDTQGAIYDGFEHERQTVKSISDFRNRNNKFQQNNIENRPLYVTDEFTGNKVLQFSLPKRDLPEGDSKVVKKNKKIKHYTTDIELGTANDFLRSNFIKSIEYLEKGTIYYVFKDTATWQRNWSTLMTNPVTYLSIKANNQDGIMFTIPGRNDWGPLGDTRESVINSNGEARVKTNSFAPKNHWTILEINKYQKGIQEFSFRTWRQDRGVQGSPALNKLNFKQKGYFQQVRLTMNEIGIGARSFVGEIGNYIVFDDIRSNQDFASKSKDAIQKRDAFAKILREKWFTAKS